MLTKDEILAIETRVAAATRKSPVLLGQLFHELSDMDWILAGHCFVDIPALVKDWRTMKKVVEAAKVFMATPSKTSLAARGYYKLMDAIKELEKT